jgi:hypothetical protein
MRSRATRLKEASGDFGLDERAPVPHGSKRVCLRTIIAALEVIVAVVGFVVISSPLAHEIALAALTVLLVAGFLDWFVRLGSP